MDLTIAILLLSLFLVIYMMRPSDQTVPSVGILEYLPGGILHPIAQSPGNFKHTMHAVAARYGSVFHSWFGLKYTLVTTDPEDITHVLTSENFRRSDMILESFGNVAPGGIFTMPRDMHRAVRRTLRDSFGVGMLKSFEPQMNAAVKELCEVLQQRQGDVVDITAIIAMTTFRVITNVAFGSGMGKEEREEFGRVATDSFQEIMKEILGHPFRKYIAWTGVRRGLWECKRKVGEICDVFIRRRLEESKEVREARDPDVLDVFLNLDTKDEQVVRSLVVEFAMAGSHTSNQMLAWSIYETCCNERVVKEIEAELTQVLGDKPKDEPISFEELQKLGYIHKVWRETLRLHPVSAGVSRTATAETTLKGSGVKVPKGRTVYTMFSVPHLAEAIWTDELDFKPERWGYGSERAEGDRVTAGAYIPFGLGFRNCAGKFLADYEGPLILAELHRHFRFQLACKPDEVVGYTAFVDMPRHSSKRDGKFDMGVPVRVELRV